MVEIEIQIPAHSRPDAVPEIVESACAAEALTLTLKGTLARYPGSVHWHFKRGKERGTLEVTWWERGNRLWFKVATGRTGDWIEETIARLQKRIECDLRRLHQESDEAGDAVEWPTLRGRGTGG